MKFAHILLVALISAATAFGVARYIPAPETSSPQKETAFERVMRTNTLRCGYYAYAPVTIKDPTTGEMSGMAVDIMNSIGAKTGLKIEWTEEVTFGTWPAALQANKFDAVCTPLWTDASYSRAALFTRPLFYDEAVALVRADDTRFSGKQRDLNRADVTLALQENNLSESLAHTMFPAAKTISLPANTDYGMLLQNVAGKKADVAFWDRAGFSLYSKTNPNTLKVLELEAPIKLIPCAFSVLHNETGLRNFLDSGIEDLLMSGDMNRLLLKWEPEPGKTFLRVANPATPASTEK